jgi:F-type H+-transporting ATPase subunit a
MGEETTWFNFIPGLDNLKAVLAPALGREEGQGFYFRALVFQDSRFDMAHVWGALLVLAFAVAGGLAYSKAVKKGGDDAIVPPAKFGLRNLFEMFTEAVLSVAEGVMGEHHARQYLPLLGSLAIFIFFSNVLALIPGFFPPTATMKTNLGLALAVFFLTHAFGVKEHGLAYFKHFLGPIPWLIPLMLPIELVSHIARPISLSLRLLGNMAADHKVASVFFVLVPLLLPVPLLVLGVLVAIVQTLVFTLLTMVYIQGAVAHEEH